MKWIPVYLCSAVQEVKENFDTWVGTFYRCAGGQSFKSLIIRKPGLSSFFMTTKELVLLCINICKWLVIE